MTQHNLSTAFPILSGSAYTPLDTAAGKKAGTLGIVRSALLYYSFGAPTLAVSNCVCASQAVTVATTPLAVINGSLASGGVATFDVPRNVVAAWTLTAVLTITGKDAYGKTVVESSASGTTMAGKKAFKSVSSVSFSADVTGATVGNGAVLGLPYAITNGDFISGKSGLNTADAGTPVAAVTTNPATATTGDVRGTYTAALTLDGATELQVLLHISDTGPGAYGVPQFAG